jgi:naphthoate synthase
MAESTYEDILFEREGEIAWLTINREEHGNTFTFRTVREMIDALEIARRDHTCRTVVISGTGERFFCLGGDHAGAHEGEEEEFFHYGTAFPVVDLYDLIDKHSKPVIAMVNGFAVGGGNVLATVCDLTIASSTAVFRQVGPAMGSFDAGFGTAYLEESVGRKRAKEIWYLNRRYTADEAKEIGLINEVVAAEALKDRVREICAELADRGPIALATLKASFHARHAGVAGLSRIALDLLSQQYYRTEESKELGRAFAAKEAPDKKRFWR